jgi:hypothetical protein
MELTKEEINTAQEYFFIDDPKGILRCWPHQEQKFTTAPSQKWSEKS